MDKILFSSRLAEQRKRAGYANQTQFARDYDRRFPTKHRDEAGGNEGNFLGILGTLKNYENENWTGKPNLVTVSNMCDILGCDIDYLTGRIQERTHELHFICDYTGLSESAVENIRHIKEGHAPFDSETINTIFETSDGAAFLCNLKSVMDLMAKTMRDLACCEERIEAATQTEIFSRDSELAKIQIDLEEKRTKIYAALYGFLRSYEEMFEALRNDAEEEIRIFIERVKTERENARFSEEWEHIYRKEGHNDG